VVGSINMDLMLQCPHLPRPGETVTGHDFHVAPGGKGANQALAAARLGAAVALLGCVGDDAFGPGALAHLAEAGVDLTGVQPVAGCATGVAMVQVDAAGQNCIVVAPGANARLSTAHIDAARAVLAQAEILICQFETPVPVVQHAIAQARAAGVAVWLNPAPAQPLPAGLLPQIDMLVVNEGEAAVVAGRPVAGRAAAEEAAAALRAAGCGTVVVTLGADGAVWCDVHGVQHQPAPRVQAVDTTGAGDTFIGALAAAWVKDEPLGPAIDWAQQAAAFSVQRAGAQGAMPWARELAGAIRS
jgi:ribokinase